MMNRIYLDYNATAPLSTGFIEALKERLIPVGNASSIHSSGKKVQKKINEVSQKLYSFFGLTAASHHLLFHSGATEAVNTFFNLNSDTVIAYFSVDHPCIKAVAQSAKQKGLKTLEIAVNDDGSIDELKTIQTIQDASQGQKRVILHYTLMNSETGVVWDLEVAKRIKEHTNCLIYADCVQAPGKIQNVLKLLEQIDIFTFSGHKFGALTGVGFSFFRNDLEIKTLIEGGGQQKGLRSGTLNSHGIFSLEYALIDLIENEKYLVELKTLKDKIIVLLETTNKIKVIKNESVNTICLIHEELRADVMLIHFDLAGLDVSSGTACSSGSVGPSNSMRISLGPGNLKDTNEILNRLKNVVSKL